MKTIAIIGGGLSGTLTAINLLQHKKAKVVLIEQHAKATFRGVAYSNKLEYQPLNVPASKMSLFSNDHDHFYRWAVAHQANYGEQLANVTPDSFVFRNIYGDYVEDTLQSLLANPTTRELFSVVHEKVIRLERDVIHGNFVIGFENDTALEVQNVVLALGNAAPSNVPLTSPVFYQTDRYAAYPWSYSVFDGLDPHESVLLIGAGLTMVDTAVSLRMRGHKGRIYAMSRHGYLPLPHQPSGTWKLTSPAPIGEGLTALALFQWIRKEIKLAEKQSIDWRGVLDAIREFTPALWRSLSNKEKSTFLRHLRPYWETHRHRMPAASAAHINEMKEAGQFNLLAGRLLHIGVRDFEAVVTYLPRHEPVATQLVVGYVINCTGPESNLFRVKSPLIQQLIANSLIQPNEQGGLNTNQHGQVLDKENLPVDGLFAIGPLRKGQDWETTALREIRQQAESLPQAIFSTDKILA